MFKGRSAVPASIRSRSRADPAVSCPAPIRDEAWARLGTDLPVDLLDSMTTVRPLSDVPALAEQILAGQTRGRVVIDTSA